MWLELKKGKRRTAKTHNNREFVTFASEDFSSDGREGKVTDTEISDLKTGRLKLRDMKHFLEVRVEDICGDPWSVDVRSEEDALEIEATYQEDHKQIPRGRIET